MEQAREEQKKAATARARVDDQTRDIIQGLRGLGFRAEDSRRAAQLSETMAEASLEERMRVALSYFRRGPTARKAGEWVGASG